jgi:hypothetical protein
VNQNEASDGLVAGLVSSFSEATQDIYIGRTSHELFHPDTVRRRPFGRDRFAGIKGDSFRRQDPL